jgi:hypothetical protein
MAANGRRTTYAIDCPLPLNPIIPDDELHDLLATLLRLTLRQMRQRRALPAPSMVLELE